MKEVIVMNKSIKDFIVFLYVQASTEFYNYNDNVTIYLICNEDDTITITYYVEKSIGTVEVAKKLYNMEFLTKEKSLQEIISSSTVAINSILAIYNISEHSVKSFEVNAPMPSFETKKVGTYQYRKDLGKIILTFDKDWYLSLDDGYKSKIKSNYLFSRKHGSWVSRAKFPNLYSAEKVAKELGLDKLENEGEVRSFEEQQNIKATKAEARAERYEKYAENAEQRGKELQSPLLGMAGDTAFFTQPNINSSTGRSFSNYRERLFRSFEKGMEEFRKSEYYSDKAATALVTADDTKPTDKSFIQRRLNESEKEMRSWKKPLDRYYSYRDRMNSGETITLSDQSILTEDKLHDAINRAEEGFERALSKWVYYDKCMQEIGGVQFSRENIHKGDVIVLNKWGKCEVLSTGPKNIRYRILEGGAAGLGGSASYASITEKIEGVEIKQTVHPFKVGEVYSINHWDGDQYVPVDVKIIKATDKSVTCQIGEGKPFVRRPQKRQGYREEKARWFITVEDGLKGYFSKEE